MQPDGACCTNSEVIAAPLDRVGELVHDFANTYVYHPVVERSFSVNRKRKGDGARRQCTMYDGNSVQEEVTHHDPSSRTYSVELVDFGPGRLRLAEASPNAGVSTTFTGRLCVEP